MRLFFLVFSLGVTIGPSDRPAWSIEPGSVIYLVSDDAAVGARVTDTRDLVQYSLYVIETDEGPLCGIADGVPVAAVPLEGRWNERSEWSPGGLTLACVNGAIGKCVTWGYQPWKPGMRAFHQACIRMVRADYCGDGAGQTFDGTQSTFGTQGVSPNATAFRVCDWKLNGALTAQRVFGRLAFRSEWLTSLGTAPTAFIPEMVKHRSSRIRLIHTRTRALCTCTQVQIAAIIGLLVAAS